MSASLSLEDTLSDLLLNLCSPQTRKEVEVEVGLLLARYGPICSDAELASVTGLLNAPRDLPLRARLRLRLWAAAIRRQTGALAA